MLASLLQLLLLPRRLVPSATFMLGLPLSTLFDQPHQADETAGSGRCASSSWGHRSQQGDSVSSGQKLNCMHSATLSFI